MLIGVSASLATLASFISSQSKSAHAPPASTSSRELLLKDSVLPEEFKWNGGNVQKGPHKFVFLTGATGFIGAHVLHYLLRNTKAEKIYCLVRSGVFIDVAVGLFFSLSLHLRYIATNCSDEQVRDSSL